MNSFIVGNIGDDTGPPCDTPGGNIGGTPDGCIGGGPSGPTGLITIFSLIFSICCSKLLELFFISNNVPFEIFVFSLLSQLIRANI